MPAPDTPRRGIDPNDPPERLDELYVGNVCTGRRYHVDPDCQRLYNGSNSRRVEIAASWYPPCRCCVTGEFPRNEYPERRAD